MQRPVKEMWELLAHVKESLTPMPESFAIVEDLARRGISLYGLFEHLARTHAITPAETVFIDDSSNNVESAARLGFRTILFADSTSCAASLAEHLAA